MPRQRLVEVEQHARDRRPRSDVDGVEPVDRNAGHPLLRALGLRGEFGALGYPGRDKIGDDETLPQLPTGR